MSLESYYRKYFIVEVYIDVTLRLTTDLTLHVYLLLRIYNRLTVDRLTIDRLTIDLLRTYCCIIVKCSKGLRRVVLLYLLLLLRLLYTLLDSGPYIEYAPYFLTIYLFTFNNNSVLQNLNNATLLSS
ncbi:hypothetical protein K504DRAFT_448283 [Pleomassaria siparia CBS 279.74]|uniref:Uncharacterized protein n=1 Tax=Pleomassaria siparia CBS 279.74 TaxID=1314801 RepID=A0A6G1JZD3_9PLEO|nr:hypothetical protein K504DRAFT_448283 [Pleomassaria siparia CBS 279.74]